jgi:hypothetical protein
MFVIAAFCRIALLADFQSVVSDKLAITSMEMSGSLLALRSVSRGSESFDSIPVFSVKVFERRAVA